MKRIGFSVILVLLLAFVARGQNVEIPDTVFKNHLLAIPEINTNGDEEIQLSEAEVFSGRLDVKNINVTDLSGIEAFTNMTYLSCSEIQITELDVRENTKLENLTITYAPVDTLLLGTLPDLLRINMHHTPIREIDASGLPSLMHLQAENSALRHLDLSKNPGLKYLYCDSCLQLSSLDLRNGTSSSVISANAMQLMYTPLLNCVSVDDVLHAMYYWTHIDEGMTFCEDCGNDRMVTFQVSEGGIPVEGAHVSMNGYTYDTGADGTVSIAGVPSGTQYYSVVADGYESILASVEMEGDLTENVNLSAGTPSIAYIPDYVFKTILLNKSSINTNADSEIQLGEAQAFGGEIDVRMMGIGDLTGIEAFISITGLDCSYNNLTRLDVSRNLELTSLNCMENDIISNTQQMFVLDHEDLTSLRIANNHIEIIDLSKLPLLEDFMGNGNPLVELDLSNNPNLEDLFLYGCTSLKRLDLRSGNNSNIRNCVSNGNTSLFCMNVDDPTYSAAHWGSVDDWTSFSTDCFPYSATFHVSDMSSQALSGALVRMAPADELFQTTDASGETLVKDLESETYLYQVSAEGFKSVVGEFSIEGSDVQVDVQLEAGEADVVNIPDPVFRTFLLSEPKINADEDDQILFAEAEFYSGALDVSLMDISSLTGIEAFIHLSGLECNNLDLEILDLHSNTELEYLECRYSFPDTLILGVHPDLSEIIFYGLESYGIDLSGLPALEKLYAGSMPNMQEMDLSNNPALSDVRIQWNPGLASIDLRNGNNTALRTGYMYLNENPSLGCVSVDDPTYAVLNWTNVDESLVFSTDCNASYSISFSVSDASGPLEGAHVSLGGKYIDTDAQGEVVFEGFGPGLYAYNVIADGYASPSDTLLVESDRNKEIVLTAGTPDIVYIPDYSFKVVLLQDESMNTNGDREIQISESSAFAGEIIVERRNISDLTGLEAFTALSGFNCTSNPLTRLDVSANTRLRSLTCPYCDLEELVLGRLDSLESLFCYSNELIDLDIDQLPLLADFNAAHNYLTSMDLSTHANLVQVGLFDNKLEALDLRNGNNTHIINVFVQDNPDLSCVSVDDPTYAMENWTHIDEGLSFSADCSLSSDASLEEMPEEGDLLSQYRIYPNPVNDYVIIEGERIPDELRLFNAQGALLRNLQPETKRIQTGGLETGVYFIQLNVAGRYAYYKFIKL